MIQLYNIENKEWDTVVSSFSNYDVYYLAGYVKAFEINGDGEPFLLYYTAENLRAIYVYMRRVIADGVFDAITPYGYGGVLFDGICTIDNLSHFKNEYLTFMQEEGIVDNFVRYHPILQNAEFMRSVSNVIDLGKTIAMDLTSTEVIWSNISSKNRNMIRKAEKNGICIKHGKGMSLLCQFMDIYNDTMKKDNADSYYFFKLAFYESIDKYLTDNYEVFYAEYQGEIISMAIIIFANGKLNYHLSGSVFEYRNLAPSNLLLYKVALWGQELGFKTFHLGGGVGSGEDNLYKFKAAFNRVSDYQFSIGKEVFIQSRYDELVSERVNKDSSFDVNSKFFPLYRS